jgi:hypothetical protein
MDTDLIGNVSLYTGRNLLYEDTLLEMCVDLISDALVLLLHC